MGAPIKRGSPPPQKAIPHALLKNKETGKETNLCFGKCDDTKRGEVYLFSIRKGSYMGLIYQTQPVANGFLPHGND